MTINTNQIVSMTEANQNFSKVVKIADKNGSAVVFKNNKPKYVIINVEENPIFELTDDEKSTLHQKESWRSISMRLRSWQMIKFDDDKVLLLHQLITQATGGSEGVRDIGLLDSALESIYATFDGQELYPTKEEKAARLGYSLISNHAFVDGNKRIGMYVMLTFLEANGIHTDVGNDEVARVGLAVASGEMKYEDILNWIYDVERF